jgi:hypothetical protein
LCKSEKSKNRKSNDRKKEKVQKAENEIVLSPGWQRISSRGGHKGCGDKWPAHNVAARSNAKKQLFFFEKAKIENPKSRKRKMQKAKNESSLESFVSGKNGSRKQRHRNLSNPPRTDGSRFNPVTEMTRTD